MTIKLGMGLHFNCFYKFMNTIITLCSFISTPQKLISIRHIAADGVGGLGEESSFEGKHDDEKETAVNSFICTLDNFVGNHTTILLAS